MVTPTAADVLITAPTSASPELEFQGGPFIALNTQFVDASLEFDVTELDPNQKLTTAELKYTGGTSGTGTTSITEDIDDMNNNLIGEGSYVVQQGFAGSANAGTIAFAGQQEIQVSKDIMLYGSALGDSATLSDFTQTFNATTTPVPEPSSIVMAIFGSGWPRLVRLAEGIEARCQCRSRSGRKAAFDPASDRRQRRDPCDRLRKVRPGRSKHRTH